MAAEKKSLGEIAKELSAMWGVDAKEIDHWPSSQTSQTGSNHCWMDGWMDGHLVLYPRTAMLPMLFRFLALG